MNEYPTQRHINCEKFPCHTCLDDANDLAAFLSEHMELGKMVDVLGEYRKWLDGKNIYAETEHGWPTANVYMPAHIDEFLDNWNKEHELS